MVEGDHRRSLSRVVLVPRLAWVQVEVVGVAIDELARGAVEVVLGSWEADVEVGEVVHELGGDAQLQKDGSFRLLDAVPRFCVDLRHVSDLECAAHPCVFDPRPDVPQMSCGGSCHEVVLRVDGDACLLDELCSPQKLASSSMCLLPILAFAWDRPKQAYLRPVVQLRLQQQPKRTLEVAHRLQFRQD